MDSHRGTASAADCRFFQRRLGRRDETALERFRRHASHGGYNGYRIVDGVASSGSHTAIAPLRGNLSNELTRGFPDARTYDVWMTDRFEIPELAVREAMRRRGYGTALLARLLDETDAKTAILATRPDNKPARRLVERTGWQVIHEPYDPFGPDQPCVLLGRKLTA
ncbi:N-acetyltransferase [Thermobacillus sp. ZCTH02-B1]|uniref:GNAT family N-acetyltransferase n=1 Tax=Thermobacillus sp. ZCTH02-B1 TaxID=1858795 RepID=UPI0025F92C27|nr:GNAT family N-acetyltransferase [Thermobacillus sp. ZCTH02-B1]